MSDKDPQDSKTVKQPRPSYIKSSAQGQIVGQSSSQQINTMSNPINQSEKFDNSIAKLNGSNWATWKWQLFNILDAKNLRQILTASDSVIGTPQELSVRQLLACSLEPDVVTKVLHCTNAPEIWAALQSCYENRTTFALTDLIGKMNSIRMTNLEQIESGLSEILAMSTRIKSLGGSVDKHTIESAILRALPEGFAQFITTWEFVDEEKRTIDHLQARLLRQVDLLRNSNSGASALAANHVRNNNSGSSASGVQGDKLFCNYCKKNNHLIQDCRKLANKRKRDGANQSTSSNRQSETPSTNDETSGDITPNLFVAGVVTGSNSPKLNLSSDSGSNKVESIWIADCAASFHMTRHVEWMTNYEILEVPLKIKMGNGSIIEAIGKGSVTTTQGIIKPVYHLPEATENLFSASSCARNHEVYSSTVKDGIIFVKNGKTILSGTLSNANLYEIKLIVIVPQYIAALSSPTLMDWHEKLGHISFDKIKSMQKKDIVNDLKMCNLGQDQKCESCAATKTHRHPHPTRSTPKSKHPGEVLHMDTVTFNIPSLGGSKYFVLIKDEFSSYKIVFFAKLKSEITNKVKSIINQVKLETGNQTLKIFSDQGSEFKNVDLSSFISNLGTSHEMSNVRTPEQNGLIERENRTIIEAARTLIYQANLTAEYWAEAVNTSVYLLNRVPNSRNPDTTPYELWHCRKPSLANLHKFGEKSMVRISMKTPKFEATAKPMIFTGYTERFNSFRFIDPITKTLHVSCDVTFLNKYYSNPEGQQKETPIESISFGLEIDQYHPILSEPTGSNLDTNPKASNPVIDTTDLNQESTESKDSVSSSSPTNSLNNIFEESIYDVPMTESTDSTNEIDMTIDNMREEPADHHPEKANPERMATLRPRQTKPNYMPWKLNLSTIHADDDPTSFSEAMGRADKDLWLSAMQEELNSLKQNCVWKLVKRPTDRKIVTNRWVFRIKRKANGDVDRYRARLVARGFSQVHGIDYNLTFAPVVNATSVRFILAYAAMRNLLLAQFDIKTAFLYGKLEEQVFMEQPQGFCSDSTLVCLLQRSLYGLKQAPRQWSQTFRNFLQSANLNQCEHDNCVFYSASPLIIIAIYVDDGLILAKDQATINNMMSQLRDRFNVHELDCSTFLGFQLKQSKNMMIIHQEAYINKLLVKFRMENSKPEPTPVSNSYLTSQELEQLPADVPYREAVGSLLYAAVTTRIDIAFAVGLASRAVANPKVKDWQLVKRIFRYLSGARDFGLCYKASSDFSLSAYCDASYADDVSTARSTTGLLLFFAGAPIQWRSMRQAMVTKSVSEAEYIAICTATTDLVILRKLGKELAIIPNLPSTLLCDNDASVRLANNEKSAHRTRHMHVKVAYTREQIERGELKVIHTPGTKQRADPLTKPVSISNFNLFRSSTMVKLSLFTILTTLSIINSCQGYRFDEVSHIVHQPTDNFIDLGVSEYTIDFTFFVPCNAVFDQHVASTITMGPRPPNVATNSIPASSSDPLVNLFIQECDKAFQSTWLVKLREIETKPQVESTINHSILKRNIGETITVTVVTNFIWKMVERLNPWSDYNRINSLEQQQMREKELMNKFGHAFNLTTFLERGVIEIIKNNSITLREQHQINHLTQMSTRYTWLATYIETRLLFATADLKSIIEESRHGRVATAALSNLINITEIADIDNRDTAMLSMHMISPQTIRFRFNTRVKSKDTLIYRVHAVKYWDNLTEIPQLMEYQGPKFVVYNTTINCIKGIDEPIERAVSEECSQTNFADPELSTWRVLISTRDIYNNHKSVSIIKAVNFNYVYCFPFNITIVDGTYRCPTKQFKVPVNIGFNTLNRTVTATKKKLRIKSDIDRLFVDDVHISHFPNMSIATTGVVMFDRVQSLLKQVEDLNFQQQNSVSIEKNSKMFWIILSVLILLMTTIVAIILYNLSVTRRSHKEFKQQGNLITRELTDLRKTYKIPGNTVTNQSSLSTSTLKPRVAVEGDVTINISKSSRPLPELPET